MEKPKEILFEYLDKYRINYETHYIDDTGLAFDAIEEAMFEFARKYHEQKVKSVDLAVGCNEVALHDLNGKTVPVTFHVTKGKLQLNIEQ